MDAKEILIRTRELIANPHAWGKYARRNAKGQYCVLGAIEKAQGTPRVGYEMHMLLRDSIATLFPARHSRYNVGDSVAHFNDHDLTSHRDVMLVLDDAIARLEEREG